MKNDTKIGLLLFVVSVFFLLIIIPNYIEVDSFLGSPVEKLIGPKFFATVLGIFMVILSLALIFSPLTKKMGDPPKMVFSIKLRVIGVIGISILYISLMSYAGYFVATFLALTGLFWIFGVRRIYILMGYAFLFSLCLYLIFGKVLMIVLP